MIHISLAYGVRGAVEISSNIDNFMIRAFKQISNEFTMNTGSMTRNTKKKKKNTRKYYDVNSKYK